MMKKFKHDVNKVIEGCADVLEKEMNFNPFQVLRNFHLFGMDFFENTPDVPEAEKEDWYYLRDSGTHAAVIYNHETKELRLIEPEKYWVEEVKEMFRISEDVIQEQFNKEMKVINETRRSECFRIMKPILKWFTECPLPWVQTRFLGYHKWSFVLELLKDNPKWFNLEEGNDLESIKERIVNAYNYEELPREKNIEYVDPSIHLHRKDGKVYLGSTRKFRTPTDVLEFFIKHKGRKVTVTYDEDAYYKYNLDVYY